MTIDPNTTTLDSYEGHIQQYVDVTPHEINDDLRAWIDKTLSRIPKGARILEIGSGFGRDADYIERAGYNIIRSDAAKGFVDLLRKAGHKAYVLNALTEPLGGPYAMVFADAVFLHFTPAQLAIVLSKANRAMPPGGVLACSLKLGDGDSWATGRFGAPRFFHYWQEPALTAALRAAGFPKVEITIATNWDQKWLMVIATK